MDLWLVLPQISFKLTEAKNTNFPVCFCKRVNSPEAFPLLAMLALQLLEENRGSDSHYSLRKGPGGLFN